MKCRCCGSDITYSDYLQTSHWQSKRQEALSYADNRCQLCNKNSELHVHHRTYENLWNEPPSDLTVLCKDCHAKFHDKIEVDDKYLSTEVHKPKEAYTKEEFRESMIKAWLSCHHAYNKGSGYYDENDIDKILHEWKLSNEFLATITYMMADVYQQRQSNYWKAFVKLLYESAF